MSKFFDDTNSALRRTARGPIPVGELDIQELVGMVKGDLDRPTSSAPAAAIPIAEPLLGSAITGEGASPVATTRLQDCRAVKLPHDERKSFLSREYGPDLQAAVEAYRTLRTRLLRVQSKTGMRSVAITSTAQGEGKTLTALNLSICFSHLQDRSILLLDCDLRTKCLSRMLGLQNHPGIGEILETRGSFESTIVRTDLPNLYIAPAGTSSAPSAELFSRSLWKEFVAWCGETFQMTIADSPPILDLADTELIAGACERVLLITRSGKTRRQVLAKVVEQVGTAKLAGVVFNGCEEAAARNYYRYRGTGLPAQD